MWKPSTICLSLRFGDRIAPLSLRSSFQPIYLCLRRSSGDLQLVFFSFTRPAFSVIGTFLFPISLDQLVSWLVSSVLYFVRSAICTFSSARSATLRSCRCRVVDVILSDYAVLSMLLGPIIRPCQCYSVRLCSLADAARSDYGL